MPNDKCKSVKNNIFLLIIISAIFGLGGGFSGVILAKQYFNGPAADYSAPREIVFPEEYLRQANLIVENAKKIIVGRENNVNDIISSSQNGIVGIFRKKEGASTSTVPALSGKKPDFENYYKFDDEMGEGLVVTSDGWVLAADFAKNSPESQIIKNFVVITKNKDIYAIDKVVESGMDSYLFIHLSRAKELPVKSFVNKTDLVNSQSLIAVNWRGESYLTSVVDKKEKSGEIRDSDRAVENIVLSNNLGDYFETAFIFSLNGEVAGFFDKKFGLLPLDDFQPLIRGLLEKKEFQRASLGVRYVNLADFAIKEAGFDKGAYIYSDGKTAAIKEGGAAALAGLKEGDIILSVNNTKIEAPYDLAGIISRYSAGDEINLIYRRNGREEAVKIKLGELLK
jgi:hypothetical protein